MLAVRCFMSKNQCFCLMMVIGYATLVIKAEDDLTAGALFVIGVIWAIFFIANAPNQRVEPTRDNAAPHSH